MKGLIIGVLVLAAIAVGFFIARGPEPHIVIPGDELWTVGPLTITSTLMASWLTVIVLCVTAFLLTRSMTLIPSGGQNFIESAIGFLVDQVEEIAGEKNGRKFFMVIATFFLFILATSNPFARLDPTDVP
ncbi:MAG TPA: F0F1 ATP synthase subunit A, partial [Tepidiformaceae bacterium]|nr:F0F1 ATP synthase subunit A [Tepidiformaceae bacterium]